MTHDWWSRLYADGQPDAGRTAAADSLDDRFDDAARAVGGRSGTGGTGGIVRQRRPPRRADARAGADVGHAVDHPPGHDPERAAWPEADPDDPEQLVCDTELDGAGYGALTVRTASVRGDAARLRGLARDDALLTARFGAGDDALLLLAAAGSTRGGAGPDAGHRAARAACRSVAGAVGRSQAHLVDDLRAGRRGALKSGLGRLTGRGLGPLRRHGPEPGAEPAAGTAWLRCLLLPVDPRCRTRLFFGAGPGGLFRLRDGAWGDLDGLESDATVDGPAPDEPGGTGPAAPLFRFRAAVARPGDTLLLCGPGLAEPLRGEPECARELAARWAGSPAPGLAAFLADVQLHVPGHTGDRTAAAVWEV